jgi:hypothetical protein
LVTAHQADAATREDDASVIGGLGGLTESLTSPVAEVADAVAEPVKPVTAAVGQSVAPVVTAVVKPVVEPVLTAAAPVTGPLLTPVLDAVTPVADATGLTDVRDDLTAEVPGSRSQNGSVPDDWSSQAFSTVSSAQLPAARAVHEVIASAAASVVSVRSGQQLAPSSPGPQPGPPSAPVPSAVTGGGVAGGASGPHGGFTAVVGGSGGVAGLAASSGRSPPGTIVGTAWFGYDDRDHPS